MMKNIIYLFPFLLVGLISCKKEVIEGKVKTDPEFAAELRSTPDVITINAKEFIIQTYIWRDFMPITEENGSSLISVCSIVEVDSLTITNAMELKKQYILKGDQIWTNDFTEIKTPNQFTIEGVVREGPKWGPNINVDVVCEFAINGETYRIQAKSQPINATY